MPSPSASTSDAPVFRVLTRHFLTALCRPRVLDDAGHEGLTRVYLGAIAGCVPVGLLFTRIFGIKYAALAEMQGSEAYRLTVLADTAFVLAIPMLLVAALGNLHASALFPDDTDYRVCMVLPVKRAIVFRAKLAALTLFVGGAVVAVHVALLPLTLLMWGGAGVWEALLRRLPVFLFVGGAASCTALTWVIAIHGLGLAILPVRLRPTGSAALRSAILGALIVLVPLAVRLSSTGPALAAGAPRLAWVPPLWFVGIEQALLGQADPFLLSLAWRGAAAIVIGGSLAVALYTHMYVRFDSPAASVAGGHRWRRWREVRERAGRARERASCGGAYEFTAATLWRSPLHQGVFTGLAACGLGLVVQRGTDTPGAVLAIPFVLILLSCSALKCALALPHQWRANWIFRQAERADSRALQLRAVPTLLWRAGILAPIVVAAPVQVWVGGPRMLTSVPVALACGWLLVECLLRDWRRIPFTCTYLPGQRTMAHTALLALNSYVLFTFSGVSLSRATLTHPVLVAIVLVILTAVAGALRAARLTLWKTTPLEFDAVHNDEPQTLGLSL